MTVSPTIHASALPDLLVGIDAPTARWLVDFYYAMQDFRIQEQGQVRSLLQGADEGTFLIGEQLLEGTMNIEKTIRKALDKYSDGPVPGQWAKSITGIGPCLAAGWLAHIDIEKAPTAGHIYRFAGLDPTNKWLGRAKAETLVAEAFEACGDDVDAALMYCAEKTNRNPDGIRKMATWNPRKQVEEPLTRTRLKAAMAKRPWNASLKVLYWKTGDSFVKVKGRESDYYGKVYEARKALEVSRNEAGKFAKLAAETLAERKFNDADVRKVYESGMLPAGRIELRSRRYAVKLFLAHLHHVMFEDRFGEPPPKPYIFTERAKALGLGDHTHYIGPPNWPMK